MTEVFALFERWGDLSYGESVTQAEHGRQCAALATEAGSGPELVAAALLHDIGHLLQAAAGITTSDQRRDRHHETIGADWLAPRFGPGVSQPVGLHVNAKRYLCHVDESYRAHLSPASVQSLKLQGGPLSAGEAAAFEQVEGAEAAVALRRWDEQAKDPTTEPAPLASYRNLLHELAQA